MRKLFVVLNFIFIGASSFGQLKDTLPAMESLKPEKGTICYGSNIDGFHTLPPPQSYRLWKEKKNSKAKTATFEVTYVNFPDNPNTNAKAAFQEAVDIWSTLIESDVPIRIFAVWQDLSSGGSNNVLGGANPGTFYRNFDGAQKAQTWYPVAMAEKMAGKELNGAGEIDIFAQFNSSYPNWYYGIDGAAQSGKTDLVTVVLHEIGHGLGITHGYTVSGDNGDIANFFSGLHVIYDHFLETDDDRNLVQNFVPPSSSLKSTITSTALFFKSPQLTKLSFSNDKRALLYAPSTFQSGSSVAHLDEAFYNNTENALMTPQIGTAEVHHDPGPVSMKMLADMGWVNTQIVHTRLNNTEDVSTPYLVKATIVSDQKDQTGVPYGYNADEVKLNYTIDGTNFTVLTMTPTGNPNEFSASIPTGSSAYRYYISVKDNLNRTLFKPGILAEDGKLPVNLSFTFEAGPDTEAPEIVHTPKPFLLASATSLVVDAEITDNIGVFQATVEYKINEVTQSPVVMTLTPNSDLLYSATIPFSNLQNGDVISYRINVTDNSVAKNKASSPSTTTFHSLNVVSLAATQDQYINDFNTPSSDFFGDNLFSITTPSGFSNGAIHTTHPYPNGAGSGSESNFVYQLRIPIRLKSTDATIKFDEIVLVEPGDNGSVFGDDDFFDYVVVEGSKDGGANWAPLADGYDSRANSAWLSRFNSSNDGENPPNSTGTGDPLLFKTRTINMLSSGTFKSGDEIVIRFRLFADQLVHGWGWAIDNLKIQIDDTPPVILHNHYDYLPVSSSTLSLTAKVSDNVQVNKLFIDFKINNGELTSEELPVTENVDQYTLNLTLNGLEAGDLIEYRIRSFDNSNNEAVLPDGSFFKVPVITFGTPVNQYISDFNSANTDFVGNFFSVTQPSGFSNGAIHSVHSYPNGFGLTSSISNLTFTLKKPILISASNPFMFFNEIAIIEYAGTGVKDLAVVEGSKDGGATWETLVNPYAASSLDTWKSAFDGKASGTSSMFKSRIINLTGSGKFSAGDNILIRFRLTADNINNGWGWAIDNLSIQGPVTGIEKTVNDQLLSIYPNPSRSGRITIELNRLQNSSHANIQILNAQGQLVVTDQVELVQEVNKTEYQINTWADGFYLIRVDMGNGVTLARKFVKADR